MPTPYTYPYRPEGWATDIYPMPAFTQLAVSGLERSSTWYQQVLGFADVFTLRAPDATLILAHLRWCTFGDVLLVSTDVAAAESRGRGITLYFSADDVDAIVVRAAAHRVVPLDGPGDRPWNAREVTFADPDGYRLTFTTPSAWTPWWSGGGACSGANGRRAQGGLRWGERTLTTRSAVAGALA